MFSRPHRLSICLPFSPEEIIPQRSAGALWGRGGAVRVSFNWHHGDLTTETAVTNFGLLPQALFLSAFGSDLWNMPSFDLRVTVNDSRCSNLSQLSLRHFNLLPSLFQAFRLWEEVKIVTRMKDVCDDLRHFPQIPNA